jgi:hypothetical protein
VHVSCESIHGYFQSILNEYRERGCIACRYSELSIYEMGSKAAVGTVSWELTGQGDNVLSGWRESYHLVREEGQWKIRVSTDHA